MPRLIEAFAEALVNDDLVTVRNMITTEHLKYILLTQLRALLDTPSEIDTASYEQLVTAIQRRTDASLILSETRTEKNSEVYMDVDGPLISLFGLHAYASRRRLENAVESYDNIEGVLRMGYSGDNDRGEDEDDD